MKWRKLLTLMLGAALLISCTGTAAFAEGTPKADTTGAELRASLDSLLSAHYALAVDSMMKIYDGDPAAEAASAALEANAKDMEPVIAAVYGEESGTAFAEIFSRHNLGTGDYAAAVQEGSEKAKQQTLEEIQAFTEDMAAFLATATQGKLPEAAAETALREHEDFVQNTFDLYVSGEYEAAYTSYLAGFKQIFDVGSAISGAIAAQYPDKFTDPNTPAGDFRSTVNRIAAEHFALAELSMAKGFNGAEDFDFADWAQDQNTEEFRAAIASLYGEDAGEQFVQIWNNGHISVQSDLAGAAVAEDQPAVDDAAAALASNFAQAFGAFLSSATENRLPKDAAIEEIAAHENSVAEAFNHYVSGDYGAAYDSYRSGYAIMFDIGKGLSSAVVDQFPGDFQNTTPEKMPKTGFGGMAEQPDTLWLWVALSTMILAAAGTITYRQSRKA